MSMIDLDKIAKDVDIHKKKALEFQILAEKHLAAAAALEAVLSGKFEYDEPEEEIMEEPKEETNEGE